MVDDFALRDSCRLDGRWFVGHTLPRKEDLAQFHLARQGFETFLPRMLSTRRHARKVETIKAALFPRYLFIHLDLTRDRWRSVNGTVGMAHLVTSGEMPCPVPVGFVEGLQCACRDGVITIVPELAPGDSVRLIDGPFAGHVGELLRLDAKGRVELLLELLNGAVRVKVARELLEPVK
ncbi:MAG: transcription termination/antitermination protein NusG [Roseiarcus sp.]